jgi:hypothetical protein
VSVISEVLAGIVGIGGLAFGCKQSTPRLAKSGRSPTWPRVRDVIERSAIQLHRVDYMLDPVKQDLEGNAREGYAALGQLGREYDELVTRVKVRLGPGPRGRARAVRSHRRSFIDAAVVTAGAKLPSS